MAKIIAIDRKLRHLDRKLVLDTDDATCCCGGPAYLIFRDCCTGVVTFAVREDIARIVRQSCPDTRFLYVFKIDGRDQCNFHDPIAPTQQSRVDLLYVQVNGIPIIDDAGRLSCVPTLQSNNWARCYTTSCPVCDTANCCLRGFYRKRCPVLETGGGEALVCCNFGNNPTGTYYWNKRRTTEEYTYIRSGSIDGFCPPGCYSELLRRRAFNQWTGRIVYNYRICDNDGFRIGNGLGTCLSRDDYTRMDELTRLYAIEGHVENATNCTQYRDVLRNYENRITDCSGYQRGPYDILPGYSDTWFPLVRATRLAGDPDGGECTEFISVPSNVVLGAEICNSVNGHVATCTRRFGGALEVTTYTTSFVMTIGCGEGRFYFDQVAETRAEGQWACPDPGSLLRRTHETWEATYSISMPSRRFCDADMCDGYVTEPGSGPDIGVVPRGALALL